MGNSDLTQDDGIGLVAIPATQREMEDRGMEERSRGQQERQ